MSIISTASARTAQWLKYANMGESARLKQIKKFETTLKMAKPSSVEYKTAEMGLSNLQGINTDAIAMAAGQKPQGTIIKDVMTEPTTKKFDFKS